MPPWPKRPTTAAPPIRPTGPPGAGGGWFQGATRQSAARPARPRPAGRPAGLSRQRQLKVSPGATSRCRGALGAWPGARAIAPAGTKGNPPRPFPLCRALQSAAAIQALGIHPIPHSRHGKCGAIFRAGPNAQRDHAADMWKIRPAPLRQASRQASKTQPVTLPACRCAEESEAGGPFFL